MNISQYLEFVNNRYQSGISREHSYRADLENLIRSLVPEINVTNEPADVTDCGNPDYVLTKGKIPVGNVPLSTEVIITSIYIFIISWPTCMIFPTLTYIS